MEERNSWQGAGARPITEPLTTSSGTSESTSGGIVDRVRQSAAAQLSSQKDKATDGLGTVASAVRQTTQSLRDQHHDTVAHYVEQAADQIERFSQRIKQKDVGELLEDAQRLARRQPALFIGGAFAVGLLGARFLKSSAPHGHYGSYRSERDTTPRSYGSTSPSYSSPSGTTVHRPSTGPSAGSSADRERF